MTYVKIGKWAHQWKMSLNSDPSKHVQEVILRRKVNKESHPPLIFNNTIFYQASSPKHLSIILGNRL